MKRFRFLLAFLLLCLFTGASFAGPPIQVWTWFSIPGPDGKPVQAMVVPGPAANTWAMVIPGQVPWQLAPMGQVVPPPPPPPPPPVTKFKFCYVVYESGGPVQPSQARVLDDKGWKDQADKLAVRWIIFDETKGVKSYPEVVRLAKAKGLPAVVWLAEEKSVLPLVDSLPPTPPEMEALVRQRGGGK